MTTADVGTITAATRHRAPVLGAHDRLFYGAMAIATAITVFAGFGSTYYFRFLSGAPTTTLSGGPFPTTVHIHVALFTAWVLLFVGGGLFVASIPLRLLISATSAWRGFAEFLTRP